RAHDVHGHINNASFIEIIFNEDEDDNVDEQ
ncbi:unnamed protein product, partial [Rotaria sp. Silwood2]